MKIFLADTDTQTLSRLETVLHRSGFACEVVSVHSGFHHFSTQYSASRLKGVFLLGGGLSDRLKRIWTTQLKKYYEVMAVMALVHQDQIDAIFQLMQLGVDEWGSTTIRSDELVARLGILLRRKYANELEFQSLNAEPYHFSSFPNKVVRNGQEIPLTAKEYEVALFLFKQVGQPVSRQTISETIWKCPLSETGRTVDTHVSRVRSRLGLKDGVYGYMLEQVYGYGYMLAHV